jgi:catechol 2,3-dioxygenase-like lactoylglutathione lyase family enzyme
MTLDTLHHVAVQVTDIAAAVAWYRARFNCEVAYQDDTWALLRFANASLALVVPGQHPPHVAIVRDDAAAFGPLKPHRDGTASIYLPDPDGNQVEVLRLAPSKD